jgi:hypothetical protein
MNLDAARALFRKELGLPEHGRLVMTGHQCSLWHAGILAKYVWCDRLVRRKGAGVEFGTGVAADGETRGTLSEAPHAVPLVGRPRTTSALLESGFDHAARLWVDQDTDETHSVRVPVRVGGRLEAKAWALKPAPIGDIPAASMPAFVPAPFTGEAALPQVAAGIARAASVLSRYGTEPSAARQFAASLSELMSPLVRPVPGAFATAFMQTSLGRWLTARMTEDPRACVDAYNRAVAANPAAKMTALALGDRPEQTELPLWMLAQGKPRERVFAGSPASMAAESLAPRALLMTGMARLAACDLFVHGTGGGIYDTITEAWFRAWLGVELAPTVVVTADLRLPLHAREISEKDVAAARWKAHHARHEPAMLDDLAAARRKAAHVEAIRAARAGGLDPAPIYREMHGELDQWRRAHAEPLEALSREAEELDAMLAEREIASDRTWPFIWHDPAALRGMDIRVL